MASAAPGTPGTHPGTASADGLTLVSQHDLDGRGDGMQVLREGDVLESVDGAPVAAPRHTGGHRGHN